MVMPGGALLPSSPVRMVALDLDGTILERGECLTPAVVAALRRLAGCGVRCVTATGRPLPFQLALLARHDLGAVAGTPSALMVDERELFFLQPLGAGSAGVAGHGPGGTSYLPHSTWNDAVRRRWRALHPQAMAWLERAQAESCRHGWPAARHLTDVEAERRGLPTLAFEQPEHAAALCDWLSAALATQAPELACNRNVRLVQIHDAQLGKGPVLAELARRWGIPPGQVLAIGDSLNDASMLDGHLGFRVATVGNADEHIATIVRRAGGYVAAARLGEGVIEILQAYGVGRGADGSP